MVWATIINFFSELLQKMLGFINIPDMPAELYANLDKYIALIFDNGTRLLTFFVPRGIVIYGIPVVLVLISAKYIYMLVMWIIRKIPLAGMS